MRYGDALATGDFNGDGLVDLATGVPGENTGTTNDTGLVDIFYSPWSSTRSQGLQGIDQALLGDTRETDDDFGTALAPGDFNGDGFDDLAIGVPGEEIAGGATDQGWCKWSLGVEGTEAAPRHLSRRLLQGGPD